MSRANTGEPFDSRLPLHCSRLCGRVTFGGARGSRNRYRGVGHRSDWLDVGKTRVAKIVGQYGMSECDCSRPIRIEEYQRADARAHRRAWILLELPLMNRGDCGIHQQWMALQHPIVAYHASRRNAQSDVDRTGCLRGQGRLGIGGQNTLCNPCPHLFRLDVLNSPAINLRRQASGGLGITRHREKGYEREQRCIKSSHGGGYLTPDSR